MGGRQRTAANEVMAPGSGGGGGGGGGSDFSVLVLGSDFATDAPHPRRPRGVARLPPRPLRGQRLLLRPRGAPGRARPGHRPGWPNHRPRHRQVLPGVNVNMAFALEIGLSAPVIDGERLKKYVFYKLRTELPVGPFCILYMHSTVQSEDNNPGMSTLRTIYEELPPEYKERLQVFYFVHPGLRSRLAIATLGRLFLSGGLYWKIKYISRLEYLWGDIKKGQVEIPDFVIEHDKVLEHRPLTDYGIEPDPLHLADVPAVGYSLGRYEDKWTPEDRRYSSNYM